MAVSSLLLLLCGRLLFRLLVWLLWQDRQGCVEWQEHPCLVPDFSRKAFSFAPLRVVLAVGCHKGLRLCEGIFPLYPLWWELSSWMDVWLCLMPFLHLLRWSSGLALLLMWVEHRLICVCWRSSQTWYEAHLAMESAFVLCIVGFVWLNFVENICREWFHYICTSISGDSSGQSMYFSLSQFGWAVSS